MARRRDGQGEQVDLARERRIRAIVGELKAALDANPALAERTGAMLAGTLPAPDLEEPMTNPTDPLADTKDAAVSYRAPRSVLARADALVPRLAAQAGLLGFRVSRSSVLRLALLRGLDVLEAELGSPATPASTPARRGRSKPRAR